MKLIVGLGNPGVRYESTRHNAGFMVLDELARNHQLSFNREAFEARLAEGFIDGQKVILMKPETFMNNSGHAIRQAMNYYKLSPEDVLVIYDDLDTPVGQIRLRTKGSAGGHNGIKSVIACMLTDQFNRIRVGISRNPKQIDLIDYVLSKFRPEERPLLDEAIKQAAKAAEASISTPFDRVMSQYNPKKIKKPKPEKKREDGIETIVIDEPVSTEILNADRNDDFVEITLEKIDG